MSYLRDGNLIAISDVTEYQIIMQGSSHFSQQDVLRWLLVTQEEFEIFLIKAAREGNNSLQDKAFKYEVCFWEGCFFQL